MVNLPKVSVIIPANNEQESVGDCIESLIEQTYSNLEILAVDDGSSDKTVDRIKQLIKRDNHIRVYRQPHQGPGVARNLGSKYARGEILVFVDADMTFDKQFIQDLIQPILDGKIIGTDSQNEFLLNKDNYWALCWNMGRFATAGIYSMAYKSSMIPRKSRYGMIYRAILREEFERVGGFDSGGDYRDDESLARKLGRKALSVKGAKFYHRNPENLMEVWNRASWIGASKDFTRGTGRKLINLLKFFPLMAPIKSVAIAVHFRYPSFILFKTVYDAAIWTAILKTL